MEKIAVTPDQWAAVLSALKNKCKNALACALIEKILSESVTIVKPPVTEPETETV